jgi:hypothetical protein
MSSLLLCRSSDRDSGWPAGQCKADHSLGQATPCSQSRIERDRDLRRQGAAQVEAVLWVIRGCPLGTVQDRCEWHACGAASDDDPRTPWRRWLRLDRRVRPVLGQGQPRQGATSRPRQSTHRGQGALHGGAAPGWRTAVLPIGSRAPEHRPMASATRDPLGPSSQRQDRRGPGLGGLGSSALRH